MGQTGLLSCNYSENIADLSLKASLLTRGFA